MTSAKSMTLPASSLEPDDALPGKWTQEYLAFKRLLPDPAQIDTAVDRTLIPEILARNLKLPQLGILTAGGVAGAQP